MDQFIRVENRRYLLRGCSRDGGAAPTVKLDALYTSGEIIGAGLITAMMIATLLLVTHRFVFELSRLMFVVIALETIIGVMYYSARVMRRQHRFTVVSGDAGVRIVHAHRATRLCIGDRVFLIKPVM